MYPHQDRRSARAVAICITKEQVDEAVPQALFIAFTLMASAAVATSLGFLLV